jgi:hypothetical protein
LIKILSRITQIIHLFIPIILIISINVIFSQGVFPPDNVQKKVHKLNKVYYSKTNFGNTRWEIGIGASWSSNYLEVVFPRGSINSFKLGLGFWLGAKVNDKVRVSTSSGWDRNGYYDVEFWPDFNKNDTIYKASKLTVNIPGGIEPIKARNFFTEVGLLHPDYYPVSEEDLIIQYYDNKVTKNTAEAPKAVSRAQHPHKPLNAHVIERTMAWSHAAHEQTIFIEYFFINEGEDVWEDVYFACMQESNVGTTDLFNWDNDYIYYNHEHKALIMGNDPRGDDDLINDAREGLIILGTSYDNQNNPAEYMFHQWSHGPYDAVRDTARYNKMASGKIGISGSPDFSGHQNGILGLGSLGSIEPGDTLHVTAALVMGNGERDVLNRIEKARVLYNTNFKLPSPPNPPRFTLKPGNHQVEINWQWKQEYNQFGNRPEESYDPAREDSIFYDFEGYKIYRSQESPQGPWSLIAQFDSLNGFGYEQGLQYKFTDKGLKNGIEYYYAVTSFDRKDTVANQLSLESPKTLSTNPTIPGPNLENGRLTDDKPYAVPNPYRADQDYTEGLNWESSTQEGREAWFEIDRKIAFMNLPAKCSIKIFTINGYLVKKIEHNREIKGHNVVYWNLLNINNHTVGSGVYYFVVQEDKGSKYVNKFVIIK